MAKKRKSVASRLDEVDRTMYSTFCSAANSLSQLYTQAMNQQRVSFHAGERHALERLNNWMLRKLEEGSNLTTTDVLAYLQNELECGAEDAQISQRLQPQHHLSQPAIISSAVIGQAAGGHGPRNGYFDQAKNLVSASPLSRPIVHILQPHQSAGGSVDRLSHCSGDTSMDMYSDGQ